MDVDIVVVRLLLLLIGVIFVFVADAGIFIPIDGRRKSKPTSIGILVEYCDEDRTALDALASDVANYTLFNEVDTYADRRLHVPMSSVWTVDCHQYGQLETRMSEIVATKLDRFVVAASRETLRFVESMLLSSTSSAAIGRVRAVTSLIATNNELTAGHDHPIGRSSNQCKERAGGRQFWAVVSTLLLDVIDIWQWRNLYLYVDEIYGLAEARQVHAAFKSYRKVASLKLVRTTRTTNIGDFLRRLSHFENDVREVKAVIIICGRQDTLELVHKAGEMGLFSIHFRWLIFESGSQGVLDNLQLQYDTDVIFMRHVGNKTLESSVLNAIGRHISSRNDRSQDNVSSTQNCTSADNTDQSSEARLNRSRIALPSDLKLEILRARRRVSLSPSLKEIGTWSPVTGMTDLKQELISDMDGVVLQVVALDCPPYVIVQKGKGGNVTFEGYLVDVLAALARIINFRFNISLPYDHTYGRCEDGVCTGIIGFLVRKEADLALANLTPTGSRVELMDFSATPVDKAGLSILFKRPTKTDENIINAYFMPFSMPVSICVGVTIPVLGIMLYTVLYFGSQMNNNVFENEADEKDPIQARHNRSLGRCLFAALQSFGQQGIDVIPATGSGRAVFGIMWLFSLFVISAYTANLISYFTATFVTIPFRSFEEMFLSRKYRVGFMKGTTYMDDIQGENGTLLMSVWKQLEKQRFSTMVDDLDEGIERVRNERYIFVHEARVLEHIVSKDCEFTTMNERYLSAPMLLAFQKGSQFKRPISEMLLRMSESGLLEKLKNKWWPPTMDCAIAAQTFQSISLWGVTSIMGVLAGGLFIGTNVMLLERCFRAQRQRALRLRSTIAAGSSLVLGQLGTDRLRIPSPVPSRLRVDHHDQRHVNLDGAGIEEQQEQIEQDQVFDEAPIQDIPSSPTSISVPNSRSVDDEGNIVSRPSPTPLSTPEP